ncbi:TPA: hypothetical protein QCY29_005981, partial [Bacillus toyonensis]|nr:hypothetical protein [Bacillus toyonensis]
TAIGLATVGFFYSTAGGTIAPGSNLPLTVTGTGTTPDLILAANTITINTPGIYLVNYFYNPIDLTPLNTEGDAEIRLNGVAVAGSSIYSNAHPGLGILGSQPATGTIFVNVTTAGSTLTFTCLGSGGGSIVLSGGTLTSTQITLLKVQ